MTDVYNGPVAANANLTTDSIISDYENKINQNIATKIVSSAKTGKMPDFTDEETLYISKKASESPGLLDEVDVITPTPNITLKKGKTELNIGHAVTIIKKMEEKFPTGVNKDKAEEITRQVMYQEGEQKPISRESFKKAINFPIKNVSDEIKNSVWSDEISDVPKGEVYKEKLVENKSHSKNAYELRTDILGMALDWVKWNTATQIEINAQNNRMTDSSQLPTSENIMEIAQKFYKFVENRR